MKVFGLRAKSCAWWKYDSGCRTTFFTVEKCSLSLYVEYETLLELKMTQEP